jgi:hypothetical protein
LKILGLVTRWNRPDSAVEPHTASTIDQPAPTHSFTRPCRTLWNSANCTTG